MQDLECEHRTTFEKYSCPIRSFNTKMVADVVEVLARDGRDFVEAITHACGVADLNGAHDVDDCVCLF